MMHDVEASTIDELSTKIIEFGKMQGEFAFWIVKDFAGDWSVSTQWDNGGGLTGGGIFYGKGPVDVLTKAVATLPTKRRGA
jgi:hypothetical protein